MAFSGELTKRRRITKGTLSATIHQGAAIGRPSQIEIDACISGGTVTEVGLGGSAVIVGEGALRLPRSDNR